MKNEDLKNTNTLYKALESLIARIKQKKNRYVNGYMATKAIIFIGGATITILTGWQGSNGDVSNYILIISTVITLLAALEGLFNLKDKAKNYDLLLFDLRRLRDRMVFENHANNGLTENNKKYFEEYTEIIQAKKDMIESSFENDD